MSKIFTVMASPLFLVTDSLQEAIEHIRKHAIEEFKLTKHRPMKPSRILREEAYSAAERR